LVHNLLLYVHLVD